MNIAIVGQGAIGSIFSYYYRAESPTLLVKNTFSCTKKITTLAGQPHLLDFTQKDIRGGVGPVNTEYNFDCIIISVKGYQLSALIEHVQPWLNRKTRLIIIQNGMGGAQALAAAFPNNLIYTGITTDAVFESEKDQYQISAHGKLDIGPVWNMLDEAQYSPQPYKQMAVDLSIEHRWIEGFLAVHPNAQYHENISPALYTKLAINAVINPLTALMQIRNGELRDYPEQVNTLKHEVFTIYSANDIDYCPHTLSRAIDNVIDATANNFSSMYQDVKHKRQTENNTVLGYLIDMTQVANSQIPTVIDLHKRLTILDAAYK